MNRKIAIAALFVVAACGDTSSSTDDDASTGTSDTTTDSAADTPEVDVAETGADTVDEPDVSVDAPAPDAEDVAPDVAVDDEGSGDASVDSELEPDAVEDTAAPLDEGPPPDAGTACSDDGAVCEGAYVCIADVCRLPIANTTWAESEFDLVEPEELQRAFGFLKSFASDVKFVVVDIAGGLDEIPASYGAANIVEEGPPLRVRWQAPLELGALTFRPVSDGLAGDRWATDPFTYALRARATVSLPGLGEVTTSFGLDALDVTLTVTLDPFADSRAIARIEGVVTRIETEERILQERDALPTFGALFCADTDGDGSLDGYRIRFDAVVDRTVLVP